MSKLLTIGMATYDDFDGVYFSTQALRMYHDIPEEDLEIIIIDNNPKGKHAKDVKGLVNWNQNIKYIPQEKPTGTATRNNIFQYASGKYTICMDCHVMFFRGAINSLLSYYKENPDCKDLIQGPMIYDDLKNCATHFKPQWGGDMYGVWDTDHDKLKANKPFDIPMHGLGVFSCETKNWRGFNPLFQGFGAEEGYIHEKFRQMGGRTLCLPEFKWIHRFGRPNGVQYRLVLEDRIWNYFVGWLELKKDPEHPMIQEIYNNFKNRIPQHSLDHILDKAIQTILQ